MAASGFLTRARAGALAALAAIALVISAPVRRLVEGSGARRANEEAAAAGRWYRKLWSALSMQRPRPLGATAPSGTDAREMPWDQIQGHPGYGVTIERVISTFGQAECGHPREQCDLFDDLIEGDCHLRSQFEQRSQAVAGKPYVIQAGGPTEEDKRAARALAFALSRLPLIQFFEHQLTANKYGWGATEIDWGLLEFEGRTWVVPVWLANVPARRFKIDVVTNTLRLLTAARPSDGEELRPGKWVITRRPGPLARAGLMRSATFPTCYKRFGTRDWVIYANKFGLPLVLVSYDDDGGGGPKATADAASREVGQEIVRNIGSDGGAVVPSGIKVDIKEAGRGADASRTHGGLIAYCNAENSKLVTGSTLANDNSQSGQGSYSQAEVHNSVRWDNVQYDASALEESVRTQLSAAFVAFNGLAAAAPLLRMQVVRDLTPLVRAQVTAIYVNELGGDASKTQLAEELGYRAPLDEGDKLKGKIASAPVSEPAKVEQRRAA